MPGRNRSVLRALPAPLAPAATPTALGAIAVSAVNRPVSPGLERHGRCLATTGANHSCSRRSPAATPGAVATATPGAVATAATITTATVLGMPTAPRALLGLTARFAASRRRVPVFLVELLFACGKHKLLPAIATGE